MKDLVVPAPMRIIHSANTALTFCSPTSSFGRKKEKSVTRRVHSIPNNRVDKITDFIHAESSRAVSVVHCKLAWAALNTTWYIRGLTGDVSAESELSFELDIAYSRVWKCYSFWSPRCTCDKKKNKKKMGWWNWENLWFAAPCSEPPGLVVTEMELFAFRCTNFALSGDSKCIWFQEFFKNWL